MFPQIIKRIARLVQDRRFSEALSATPGATGLEPEQMVKLLLNSYKRRLLKGAAGGKNPQETIRARRRFARRKVSELARRIRNGKRAICPDSLLLSRYHDSAILSALVPNRKERWKSVLKRRQQGELKLSGFSFIEQPAETMKALKRIGEFELEMTSARLHFEDQYCIDIAPYLVLSEIWPQMARIFSGGHMRISIQKVIEAVHLRKLLGMKLVVSNKISDVWAFPLRRRRPSGTSKSDDRDLDPQSREKVADDFCDAVNDWLAQADYGLTLTDSGNSIFTSIIGELLDNAERHSEPINNDGSWSVAAFMARRKEGDKSILHCHMGFLSVGASISESLATASAEVRKDIDDYCRMHRQNGLSDETLATLVALQDGITRDRAAKIAQRGGIGLQDVMEFVSHLGGTDMPQHQPKMTIVSGRACIKLVDPYFSKPRQPATGRRMLWCNATNRPEDPPDRAFVFDLDERFAGTVVALSFVLDPDYLRSLVDADGPA